MCVHMVFLQLDGMQFTFITEKVHYILKPKQMILIITVNAIRIISIMRCKKALSL